MSILEFNYYFIGLIILYIYGFSICVGKGALFFFKPEKDDKIYYGKLFLVFMIPLWFLTGLFTYNGYVFLFHMILVGVISKKIRVKYGDRHKLNFFTYLMLSIQILFILFVFLNKFFFRINFSIF